MPPEKKKLFPLVKMLFFKYIQSKLQYTTSQSLTTLQVHITTSEAFLFFHSSLIVTNACQKFSLLHILPSCAKVLKFLLQGFAGSNVILQIYTVKATIYNITKPYNTTGSHYNFRGIFIFSLESYSDQCLSKIQSFAHFA